jgi:pimeloyl-ACP methyl ester carboxylesterase
MPPIHTDLTFACDNETLAATNIRPADNVVTHSLMSLHGAGQATRQRIFYLADALAANGCRTFCFDFSGHGASTGTMNQSSLARRHLQALAAHQKAQFTGPLTLMGNSMGGYIAVSLLPILRPDNLILICPGLYATEAYHVPFTDAFTAILRHEGSYENAHILEAAKSYRGRVQMIIGEDDTVIPLRVMDLYQNAFANAASVNYVRLPGVSHQIHGWAAQEPERATMMHNLIHDFITDAPTQKLKAAG